MDRQLPEDCYLLIFVNLTKYYYYHKNDTFLFIVSILSRVCSKWNTVINVSPRFWTNVSYYFFGFDLREPELKTKDPRSFCRDVFLWSKHPTEIMAETFEVEKGKGHIVVEGVAGRALKLDDEVVIFDWPDCCGSTGRYYFSRTTRNNKTAITEVKKLNKKVNGGYINPNVSLKSQFRSFLNLFESGTYRIRIHHNVFLNPVRTLHNNMVHAYYPYASNFSVYYGELMHFTQTPVVTDMLRIEYYRKLIRNGQRPLLVVLSVGPYQTPKRKHWEDSHLPLSVCFLLDGHHKYIAYTKENVLPSVLRIQSFNCSIEREVAYTTNIEKNLTEFYFEHLYLCPAVDKNKLLDTDEIESTSGLSFEEISYVLGASNLSMELVWKWPS